MSYAREGLKPSLERKRPPVGEAVAKYTRACGEQFRDSATRLRIDPALSVVVIFGHRATLPIPQAGDPLPPEK